ncbi:hypothetical protein F4778DRAFT_729210 [Xylariomycetidae sp. FL2044]|nr:hypothetical protein F4778DRAFT_729210 [Xylariomycetidae sp. FL2044]
MPGPHPWPPIDGFPQVASKYNENRDKTGTLYRRFDRLSARNLLFMEAELAELEALQDRYDEEDTRNRNDVRIMRSHSDWSRFEELALAMDDDGNLLNPDLAKRMALGLKIRAKLKDYHKALKAHQELLNSSPPESRTVTAMEDWFQGRGTRHLVPQLWGQSARRFQDRDDLVALRVNEVDQDRVYQFMFNYLGSFFPLKSGGGSSPMISPSQFFNIITTLLAAVILFGSIISLYFSNSSGLTIGLLALWTVLFAIYIGFLTNARKDQIFAATAAYAAVLVVFASGPIGGAPIGSGDIACSCT